MCTTAWLVARKRGFGGDESTPPFHLGTFLKSCWNSIFSLATPFVILGSIYSGLCTPVEAAVLAIGYALFVGFVINRSLSLKNVYFSLLEGAQICGAVLLIVGTSTLFGKILTFEEAPQRLAAAVLEVSRDPNMVLLMIIGVLIVLGMFMETLSTIIILVPVLMPMLHMLGIDPIHFGVILVVTNEMALLTAAAWGEPVRGLAHCQRIGGANIHGRAAVSPGADPVHPPLHVRPRHRHMAPPFHRIRELTITITLTFGAICIMNRTDAILARGACALNGQWVKADSGKTIDVFNSVNPFDFLSTAWLA